MSDLLKLIRQIDNLTKTEKKYFDRICINQGDGVPKRVAESLAQKGLVRRNFGGYDVASYWVHYAWCRWCAQQVGEEGD